MDKQMIMLVFVCIAFVGFWWFVGHIIGSVFRAATTRQPDNHYHTTNNYHVNMNMDEPLERPMKDVTPKPRFLE